MMELLLEPFSYGYMTRAIWISALVGALCGCLSGYLILKGWSLMGDALSHAVVPGVAIAAIAGFPFAAGAFFAGLLAAAGIALVRRVTMLKEDVAIGLVFSSFFALGLLIVSLRPTAISVQTIAFGNILAISDSDVIQVVLVALAAFAIVAVRWRDLMLSFFDEAQARVVGLDPFRLRILFFVLLAAATVAAMQAVGALLVIAMLVTPGATAYLLTDRFGVMLSLGLAIGAVSGALGAYASYFLDGATGALIVLVQTGLFLGVFLLAPKHGQIVRLRLAWARRQG